MNLIGQAHTMLHDRGILRIQTDIRVGSRLVFPLIVFPIAAAAFALLLHSYRLTFFTLRHPCPGFDFEKGDSTRSLGDRVKWRQDFDQEKFTMANS